LHVSITRAAPPMVVLIINNVVSMLDSAPTVHGLAVCSKNRLKCMRYAWSPASLQFASRPEI